MADEKGGKKMATNWEEILGPGEWSYKNGHRIYVRQPKGEKREVAPRKRTSNYLQEALKEKYGGIDHNGYNVTDDSATFFDNHGRKGSVVRDMAVGNPWKLDKKHIPEYKEARQIANSTGRRVHLVAEKKGKKRPDLMIETDNRAEYFERKRYSSSGTFDRRLREGSEQIRRDRRAKTGGIIAVAQQNEVPLQEAIHEGTNRFGRWGFRDSHIVMKNNRGEYKRSVGFKKKIKSISRTRRTPLRVAKVDPQMLYKLYTIVQQRIQVSDELASRRAFRLRPRHDVKRHRTRSIEQEASEKPEQTAGKMIQ